MSDERERFREDRRGAADRERALARGAGRPVPVHRPGEIEFFPAVDPDEAWNRLNPEVRGVLARRAGQPLERWARVDDGLVTAMLLGDRALVKATPNGRAHEFTELIPLNPETALLKEIIETSGGSRPARTGVERMPGSPVLDRMSQELRDFLGHLPEQAQRLMQKPFRDAAGPPRGEREIFQWETATQRDWKVFGYLHDDRWATVVAGSGVLRGEAATWRLNCRRFRVRT
ncbi:hypothetical protein Aca07nite_77730 [Actinoplanes capillaceus]|uniref:Uncharacterized protein n=1 Tax=Actinoplanes campanulatus TaxID=113559 RepID=A0ABQ3WWD3_9ACTN|nr:hypothetical protein [Actinoplanes capillaceus]GID50498.1 hypothetical protein Aca07nite_77730 [Actinoplanes capillaceus]